MLRSAQHDSLLFFSLLERQPDAGGERNIVVMIAGHGIAEVVVYEADVGRQSFGEFEAEAGRGVKMIFACVGEVGIKVEEMFKLNARPQRDAQSLA